MGDGSSLGKLCKTEAGGRFCDLLRRVFLNYR